MKSEKTSHPSWVCGLKLRELIPDAVEVKSHPSWVCGLKLSFQNLIYDNNRHTPRGCVD